MRHASMYVIDTEALRWISRMSETFRADCPLSDKVRLWREVRAWAVEDADRVIAFACRWSDARQGNASRGEEWRALAQCWAVDSKPFRQLMRLLLVCARREREAKERATMPCSTAGTHATGREDNADQMRYQAARTRLRMRGASRPANDVRRSGR